MYGVLLIAHGNKKSKAVDIMEAIAGDVAGLLPDAHVEYGFIWQSSNDFGRIFKKFDEQALDEIIIMPYFLFDGVHVTQTIRAIAAEFSALYPKKKIVVSRQLGVDKRLAEIAVDRILERKKSEDGL